MRADVKLAQLFEIVEDFFLVEFRFADDAIRKHVRNLDRVAVVTFGDHFEADLETDRVELDAFDRLAPTKR